MAETKSSDPEYRRYCTEIDQYEKEFKPWHIRVKKILKLYKDSENARGHKKRMNVLWSNVQTLLPALYARDPQPEAERRFKDADPVGRVASEVIERCLSYVIDCENFGRVMKRVVEDRLLPGRGVVWIRYKPTFRDADPGQISEDSETQDEQELDYEQVIPDYVYWEDFGHNIARNWDEVTMVWRRVYMARKELVKRFGKVGQTIPLDHKPKGLKHQDKGETGKKAAIYELWDRDVGKVCFLSKSHPKIIEAKKDPLNLTGMFPCSHPLYATCTNDSLVPVPDYALYQTQAQEIEELTGRINALQKALKVVGIYDSSAPELARLLNEGYENKMIPVETYAAFAEKGGIQGATDFLPVNEIAQTLIGLYEARSKSKEDLYEITGIADIIRGNSDPRETAKAQQIKGRFAVLRISDAQQEVQNFARDVMRIMGEIIAEHFSLETIQAISGVKLLSSEEKKAYQAVMQQSQMMARQTQQPPQNPLPEEIVELLDQPTWDEVHELISHQVLRGFRIDIETDSTIRTDEEADRQERTEFMTAAGSYLRSAAEIGAQQPDLVPLLGEMLMFGIRGHKAARSLEPVFEDALKQLQKPKEPQPNPEVLKIEAEKELKREGMQLEVQAEERKQEAQHKEELQRQQIEDQRSERDSQRTANLEQHKAELNRETTLAKIGAEAEAKVRVAQIQQSEKQTEIDFHTQTSANEKEYSKEREKSRKATLDTAKELIVSLSELKRPA